MDGTAKVSTGADYESQATIYTVGHSNHSMSAFFELLERFGINVLVDVRSNPFTRYSLHFNHDPLKVSIQNAGLKYLFLGKELGGKPREEEFYDSEGYILYERIAESAKFKGGIERLLKGVESYRIALMCGEENPMGCHRRLLIGTVLAEHGVDVLHIRGNGDVQSENELSDVESDITDSVTQLTLFSSPELPQKKQWRSSHPVLRRGP